ncbi:MAG: DHH family phosphoesterase [Planctomycetes bacterium]|nr:DHH family phosphoesterase [Planctomycetota bacterium]
MGKESHKSSQLLSFEKFTPPGPVLARIQAARRPLLLTHIYPDGDGIGSELALARGLRARGASPAILNTHRAPERYDFLDPAGEIRVATTHGAPAEVKAAIAAADLFVILDTSDPSRLGKLESAVFAAPAPRVAIDHHVCRNEGSFDALWSEPRSAATGLLVLEVLLGLGVEITSPIAEALFVAIGTDTGWFRFSNASPHAFEAASLLAGKGADPERLFGAVYETSTLGRTLLLGELLAGLQSDAGGRIVHGLLRRSQLERHEVGYEELDGFIDVMKGVRGADVLLLLVELSPQRFKVSLRSKGSVEIHSIAERFGGGGHPKAAGCRLEGSVDDILERVLAALRELLAGYPP